MSDAAPDRLTRIRLLIGEKKLARLQNSFVVVVGLGAVGSYAVEGLARAGIGRLRLVDFDIIKQSNINRQLYALESTQGKFKCDEARKRVLDINPACTVEALRAFADDKTLPAILEGNPDLVIDAIDSLAPKTFLIAETVRRGIPLIASMGAALRSDPTRVRCGNFSEAKKCPLAQRLRYRLRKQGAPEFTCVYSDEPVPKHAVTKTTGEENILPRGRERPALGSLPTLTGIFGLTIANAALQKLCGGFHD